MKIEARFYETYELCAIFNEALGDQFEYALNLNEFHCDDQWTGLIRPYEKYSALHSFIEHVLRDVHAEQAGAVDLEGRKKTYENFRNLPPALADMQSYRLPIELAFARYDIEHRSFLEYLDEGGRTFEDADEDDISSYMFETYLSQPYEDLYRQTVSEVFYVLFQNRQLLLLFNEYISGVIRGANLDSIADLPWELFSERSVLKRVRPPTWARHAVFFRDRGRCVLCDKDLSGLINLENAENYDHMVPLALHGLNDVSNLQLLCAECNQLEKRDRRGITSNVYQAWYPEDRGENLD